MRKEDKVLLVFLLVLLVTSFYIHMTLPETSEVLAAAFQDSRQEVTLPILMYHGLTEEPSKVNDYFILAEDFEKDLKWLHDHGYTSVSFGQLADYAEKGSRLPEKPVLITFDDGYYNN